MVTYTKLYWVDHIASMTVFFCLGLIVGNNWENLPFVIVAIVMMAACIAKIWAQEVARKITRQ